MTSPHSGRIVWQCPSNIALVKYWGKRGNQLPANPSLSLTLSESVTRTDIEYEYKNHGNHLQEFYFDNKAEPAFGKKIADYLKRISEMMPFLNHVRLKISSSNTFPHSAGIASSASSYGALALALCSMAEEISETEMSRESFFSNASKLARLGSGSACRSVYGGYVIWGSYKELSGTSDEYAIPVSADIHREFGNMQDSILVVDSGAKKVSSTAGHDLMNNHPFAPARYNLALSNLHDLLSAFATGEMSRFIGIMENEALTLHALMMTSAKGYLLMKPETIQIIEKIRLFRKHTGLPAGFTLDAGPNIHLIYPSYCAGAVMKFIDDELRLYCEDGKVIHDYAGKGPERIL